MICNLSSNANYLRACDVYASVSWADECTVSSIEQIGKQECSSMLPQVLASSSALKTPLERDIYEELSEQWWRLGVRFRKGRYFLVLIPT